MIIPATARGAKTRSVILQAAHDLFVSQGYHGTSMRQIAIKANLALGGLYNHFSSKEAVFEAVFLTFHPYQRVIPTLRNANGENLEELVQSAAQCMIRAIEDQTDFLNLMFIEVVEFKSIHSQQLFANLLPQELLILQRIAGSYPEQIRSIPSPMVIRTFLGFIFGYFLTEISLAPGAPEEFRQDAMQYFIDVYLHGVLLNPKKK
jgi:AcrR family transcriptional regulator